MRKISDFLVFSSIYISVCAVVMVYQTGQLLHFSFSWSLAAFVFSSTMCSYNFHWFLLPDQADAPGHASWTHGHKSLHLFFYFAGICGAAWFFFILKAHWFALCFGAFVTFLYSAPKIPHPFFRLLRSIAVGKTIFLAMVWMYVTTALPVFVSGGSWTMEATLFCISRFMFIYAICILFDFRDREEDIRAGIKSLVTWLGEKGIAWLFLISLLLFLISTLALYAYGIGPFLIIILLVPGLIVGLLYNYARRHFSDYLYYVILDGLMMFSGLLMLIFQI